MEQQYQYKYEYSTQQNVNDNEEEKMRIAHMAGIARNTVKMETCSSDSACPEYKCEEKKFPAGYKKRNVASLQNIQPKIAKAKPGPKPRVQFEQQHRVEMPVEQCHLGKNEEYFKKMETQAAFLQNLAIGCAVVAGGLFIYNYYFKSVGPSSVIVPEEIVEVAENVISN
jgi:hypothetical protein